jgi:F-type H+-transporting ATPase subunit delta
MAENRTVARPYAEAVFELARAERDFRHWNDMLELMTAVTADPQLAVLLDNPNLTDQVIATLIIDVCATSLDAEGRNFIRLLTANRRVALLPEILSLYEKLRNEAEGAIDAELVSAFPVSAEQQAMVASALRDRLERDIHLECRIDKSLLGGALIRAGDLVIDGSVRGTLDRLANVLSH